MNKVSTVTLELLRHGKRYGQLLSPLTDYMALCGSNDPVTVNLPWDHQEMLLRLRALRYKDSDTTREIQLKKTGEEMGKVLAQVPSLLAGLVRTQPMDSSFIHLQVIYSSAELALLPFEFAHAPSGFPGEGQEILLQDASRICLTRQARRIAEDDEPYYCGRPLHILFAYAQPPTVGTVPWQDHYKALRKAVEPWVSQYATPKEMRSTGQNGGGIQEDEILAHRVASAKHRLTVLPNASAKAIMNACARINPTHVHILAHGIETNRASNTRYCLALHDAGDSQRFDAVDEERLVKALRAHDDIRHVDQAYPNVVTIASCDSGQQGEVIGAGSSIAHALHVSGIPLVVASQYPLTKAGSVDLVERIYPNLLWGEDPRVVLANARCELKVLGKDNHDWASLIAYAAFPTDFSDTLDTMRSVRAEEAIDTALNDMDRMLPDPSTKSASRPDQELEDIVPSFLARVEDVKTRLVEISERVHRIYGHLAATCKREAEILTHVYKLEADQDRKGLRILIERIQNERRGGGGGDEHETSVAKERMIELLWESLRYYETVYYENPGTPWALVQILVLKAVLDEPAPNDGTFSGESVALIDKDRWVTAKVCADANWRSADEQVAGWAVGSLCELYILEPLCRETPTTPHELETLKKKVREYAELLVSKYRHTIYSTHRQIRRHVDWFKLSDQVVELADYALTFFPKDQFRDVRKRK